MAHSSVWTNPKFRAAAKNLGIDLPHLIGHLERLWHTAYEHCGRLGTLPEDLIEVCADWTEAEHKPGALLAELKSKQVLIRKGRGRVQVKHFWEHIPTFVRKRIERRELHKIQPEPERKPDGTRPDAKRDTNGSSTQPNPTQPSKDKNGRAAPAVKDGERKPKTKKPSKPVNPDVKTFIDFAFTSLAARGVPLVIIPGKDGALIKGLLETLSLARLKECWDYYLRNYQFEDCVKDIGNFAYRINKLAQATVSSQQSQADFVPYVNPAFRYDPVTGKRVSIEEEN